MELLNFRLKAKKSIFHQKKIDVEYEILKKNERKSIEHRVYNGITEFQAESEKIYFSSKKN